MGSPALFLSYNSVDRPSVVAVQRLLEARGIRTFLDREQLSPGLRWPVALEEALRGVRAVAVFIGRELGGWQKREMYFALDRQVHEEERGHHFPVLPVLLAGADLTPSFLFLNTWIDLRGGLDSVEVAETLDAFENAITGTAPTSKVFTKRAAALCPYRGLEAFHEEHAAFFAGRTAFAKQLFDFTLGKDLVAVVGPSGSGKSSVVQAGLVPLLRRQLPPETTWDVVSFTPGADPFHRLASVLAPLLEQDLSETDRLTEAQKLGERLASAEVRLEPVISRVGEKSNGTGRLLIVADQFEELFTLAAEANRRSFAKVLLSALGKAPFTLLVTLRADFYSQIITLDRELSDRLAPAQVNIGALTRDELRESIAGPAKLVGLEFEAGLVDRILNDVGSEPGNLPLLEFALTGLWSRRAGRTLTNTAYNEIDGVTGALAQRAEAEFSKFGPEEQAATRRLLSRLVRVARPEEGAEDTRQRIELQAADPLAEKVAQALAKPEVRLLVMGRPEADGQTKGQTVEVAHEALIRNWERLRGWLNEDREFLLWRQRTQIQVEQWKQHGRDTSYLLREGPLSEAERWLLGRPQDLMVAERQFIEESAALRKGEREKEERRHKKEIIRLRWFSFGLATLLLVAIGATWYARNQQAIAESRALAAQAEEALNHDQPAALNLAIRAWGTFRTSEAHNAVANSFAQLSAVLRAHTGTVEIAAFSPDGQRIVTASADHTARVWDAANGHLLVTLQGHTFGLVSAVFSPDGQRIVTASFDHTALVWNAQNGQLLATLEGHTGPVYDAEFSPDGQRIVTASFDQTARVWDAANGQLLATLRGHTGPVYDAEFSPDGQRIVTASFDQTARVWDAANGQLLATLEGHTGPVYDAEFSPDGQRIVTASFDQTARVWQAASGQLLATLQGHTGYVYKAVFSPDGQRIVTASFDQTARVWDAANGQLLATLRGHTGTVWVAAFSPDGRRMVTASDDKTARIWNAQNGQLLATLRGHTGTVWVAAFSPDGQRIVTASGDDTARVWNTVNGQLLATLQGHADPVFRAVFSPDGQRIVTASGDDTARVWNTVNGQLLATLQGHSLQVVRAVFSPNGQRIVTTSDDQTARVWNAGSGQLLATLQGHAGAIDQAAFSPDGQRLVTASGDHTARVWNAGSGQLLSILQGLAGPVYGAVFSPDGQRIVTAGDDQTARVWDAANGHLLVTLQGHTRALVSAVFSPDGQRVATASFDQTARVWNTVNGQLLATLQGHTDRVVGAVFSPDGQRIVTASFDQTARVWSAAGGELLITLRGHTGSVNNAQFSPDGQRIVTASDDHTARIWNAQNGQLLATLQGHAGPVNDAEFSPDGQRIVTASFDKTARVFRMVTLSDISDLLAK